MNQHPETSASVRFLLNRLPLLSLPEASVVLLADQSCSCLILVQQLHALSPRTILL